MDTDHIPAPAEHAPRKVAIQQNEHDLIIHEVGNKETYILAKQSVPVRR